MTRFAFILTLFLSLVISSCNNTSSHDHNDANSIELNDGQKWKVNAEMTPFILEGEKILNEFNNDDFKGLASQLKEQNNSLIKSCTMDGKSHDELHKWLHPHLEMVTELNEADNVEEANEIVNRLKVSFETYHTYFE